MCEIFESEIFSHQHSGPYTGFQKGGLHFNWVVKFNVKRITA